MARPGIFVMNFSGKSAYQSFQPAPLPPIPPIQINYELSQKVNRAHYILGQLEARSHSIPNLPMFITMYVRKEALLSSQIEGTQATMDDLLNPALAGNINQDVEEVIQYLRALNYANERMLSLPLSNRLLRETHAVLLSSVRGHDKEPGDFRRSQNWIGPQGSTLNSARFVPPNLLDMHQALADLETYIHDSAPIDPLIKIGLVHYQFETIHPFLDGNGRMGRMLISLLLKQYHLLTSDVLYLSYYLKRNRTEYYDRLMDVRLKGRFEEWLSFFIEGIIVSAEHSLNSIDQLQKLHHQSIEKIKVLRPMSYRNCLRLLQHLEAHPIVDINGISNALELSFNTSSKSVKELVTLGILRESTVRRRNRIFYYSAYLEILRDGTE